MMASAAVACYYLSSGDNILVEDGPKVIAVVHLFEVKTFLDDIVTLVAL